MFSEKQTTRKHWHVIDINIKSIGNFLNLEFGNLLFILRSLQVLRQPYKWLFCCILIFDKNNVVPLKPISKCRANRNNMLSATPSPHPNMHSSVNTRTHRVINPIQLPSESAYSSMHVLVGGAVIRSSRKSCLPHASSDRWSQRRDKSHTCAQASAVRTDREDREFGAALRRWS